jgi:hypothetical protein
MRLGIAVIQEITLKGGEKIGNDDSNDNCKSDGDTAPQRRIGSNSEECIETNISEIVTGSTQLESERLNAESHGSNDEQSEGCAKMIFDSTKPQTISDADGDIVPEAASSKLSTSPICIGSRVLSVLHPDLFFEFSTQGAPFITVGNSVGELDIDGMESSVSHPDLFFDFSTQGAPFITVGSSVGELDIDGMESRKSTLMFNGLANRAKSSRFPIYGPDPGYASSNPTFE